MTLICLPLENQISYPWTKSSVQSLSHIRLFATPWTVRHQTSLPITNSWSLLKLTSLESVVPSNHLVLCRPVLLLPSIFPRISVFSNESVFHINQVAMVLKRKHQSFQWIFRTDFLEDWLIWSSWCPRDSQQSSPIPQLESMNSLVLSFLYGPTLTSIHDF